MTRLTPMGREVQAPLGVPFAASLAIVVGACLAGPSGLAAQAVPEAEERQDTAADAQGDPEGPDAGGAAVAGLSTANYDHAEAPRSRAVRLEGGSLSLDGILDEAAWADAPPITDFIQIVPLEGRPGSEQTEVRILYDDEALYVGANLSDSQPVSTQLVRRDGQLSASDAFEISFDSYHEHETAYRFGTNPSAIRRDAIISGGGRGFGGGGGGGGDSSWDPVWNVATEITDRGWSLEMRIPFSQLRFQPAEEQTWGIRVERTIQRNQERVLYPFVPSLERGGISRYGHLDELRQLDTGKRLELLPYVTARGEYLQLSEPEGITFDNPYRSGSDHFGDAGLDLKYRLGSNLTLDATVNPDFGQVEVDPSVINLSAFETRYQERRPFFVEGADIFQFGEGGPRGSVGNPPDLLYSRRIGRAPQGAAPSDAVFEDTPGNTTIYQAGKVSGRVGEGWSVGLLEAVTAEETVAYLDTDGNPGQVVAEPRSSYVVGRLRKLVGAGDTRFGAIASAVNRSLSGTPLVDELHSSAYTGGIDFAHEWDNREWRLSGVLAASQVQGSATAISLTQRTSSRYYDRPDADHLELDPTRTSLTGYFGFVEWQRQAGTFTPRLVLGAISPGYEVNDMGFQSEADRIIFDTHFQYEQPRPGDVLRSWNIGGGPDAKWNYDGRRIFTNVNVNFNFQYLNYWRTQLRLAYEPRYADDRLTRGGPMAESPRNYDANLTVRSDSRRNTTYSASVNWRETEAGSWTWNYGLDLETQPRESLLIRFGPNLRTSYENAQYVTSVEDATATATYGRRYVFAGLNRTTLSLDTRVNLSFTPDLSVQLYVEPFISVGDYGQLREFAEPDRYVFSDYGRDVGTLDRNDDGSYQVDPDGPGPGSDFRVPNRDFNYRSLIGNAVLRWEWRPGSTLYLVWQQQRIDSVTGADDAGNYRWVGDFDLSRDTRHMFSTKPDNVFAVKVSYWLNP